MARDVHHSPEPEARVRIAVVSDIHGNLAALNAVLRDLELTSPDLVIHGGDLALNGSSPADVLDTIRELGWPGVLGNTDELLWRPELLAGLEGKAPERHGLRRMLFTEMAPATLELLGGERLAWLQQIPLMWSDESIAVLHAATNTLWRAPLASASPEELAATFEGIGRPQVVYAHIHHPFHRQFDKWAVANTGSVSLSYDSDPRASYLLIDGSAMQVRRVDYDREQEIRRLGERRYPNAGWLASILRTGQYRPPTREAQPGA